jgi:hypothetical protein
MLILRVGIWIFLCYGRDVVGSLYSLSGWGIDLLLCCRMAPPGFASSISSQSCPRIILYNLAFTKSPISDLLPFRLPINPATPPATSAPPCTILLTTAAPEPPIAAL